ncbi:hypothetical protein Tsubulata_047308 [Turnera subulata]|uniref:RING-type E3 ubiquitin transferase n=1 Tax=Turnera subulata TaxID=218843 RepID=A0A9Q0JG00_9ROSI|nr:hypothetical protein Tsubulata_047308 [Turnera subulata]
MVDLYPSHPFMVPPPPPPHPSPNSNLPMLYYGLVVVGVAAVVLVVYNLLIVKWCTQRDQERSSGLQGRQDRFVEVTASRNLEHPNSYFLSSYKYKRDNNNNNNNSNNMNVQELGIEYECPVCLSVFEEGEEVRQLPRCKHSFHAPCIDMWLYSHSDCPLCRAKVNPPPTSRRRMAADAMPENSREGLLLGSAMAV